MTVPSKGGRPRKWRSDVDRVRAFRARQRGDEEPATLEVALADGDELARAVDRIRQLRIELAAAGDARKELEAALAAEQRRTETARRRLDRAQAALVSLRASRAERIEELSSLVDEIGILRVENAALRLRLGETEQPPVANGPNRAMRRKAVKQDRRIR